MGTDLPCSLLLRIERTEGAVAIAEAHAAKAPMVRVGDFRGAVAVATLDRHNTLFNRCGGLGPDDAEVVGDVVAFYDELGVPPRLDVCPKLCSKALLGALKRHGLEASSVPFFSRRVLIGSPDVADRHASQVRVEPVRPSEIETFVAIQDSVWQASADGRKRRLENARNTHALRGRHRYFAYSNGTKVAIGAMDVVDDVAYLNGAATLDADRRRGCQIALLLKRLQDASRAGAKVAFALAAPDSQSQRNVERVGLVVAYDREIWMRPGWRRHPFYRDAGSDLY